MFALLLTLPAGALAQAPSLEPIPEYSYSRRPRDPELASIDAQAQVATGFYAGSVLSAVGGAVLAFAAYAADRPRAYETTPPARERSRAASSLHCVYYCVYC